MKRIIGISGNLGSGKDTVADYLVEDFNFAKIGLADPMKRYALRVFHFTEDQLWGPSESRNDLDPRFQHVASSTEGDDAWMAAFRRAEQFNREFVESLFPSPVLRSQALNSLKSHLVQIGKTHQQISPRIVLQELGTEWGRTVSKDVWINHGLKVADELLRGGCYYSPTEGVVPSADESCAGVVISDVRYANELSMIRLNSGFLIKVNRAATDRAATAAGIKDHLSETEQQSFSDDQFNMIINNDSSLEKLFETVDIAGFILMGDSNA